MHHDAVFCPYHAAPCNVTPMQGSSHTLPLSTGRAVALLGASIHFGGVSVCGREPQAAAAPGG